MRINLNATRNSFDLIKAKKRLSNTFLLLIFVICSHHLSFGQKDSVSTGTASFYASKFNGRKTSSGEIFRQDSLTAAHKYFPFGTLLRVTDLSNDSTVVVRVNDRLPKSSKRSIDLSRKAAEQLNFIRKGLTKVRIEVIEERPDVDHKSESENPQKLYHQE